MDRHLFSIGHSNRSKEEFVQLLRLHGVNVVCDVRSHPFSRQWPHFNKAELQTWLKDAEIAYVFLGEELGGRPADPTLYDQQGRVSYEKLSLSPNFRRGVERLLNGIRKSFVPALLCAERDPAECHRAILIGRHLSKLGCNIEHILDESSAETQKDLERRLMSNLRVYPDMLRGETPDSVVNRAYEMQGQRIAYVGESCDVQ